MARGGGQQHMPFKCLFMAELAPIQDNLERPLGQPNPGVVCLLSLTKVSMLVEALHRVAHLPIPVSLTCQSLCHPTAAELGLLDAQMAWLSVVSPAELVH